MYTNCKLYSLTLTSEKSNSSLSPPYYLVHTKLRGSILKINLNAITIL